MALLEADKIKKSFGGVRALSDMSLTVDAGEAVGLVGPNGAGKTTLFNCLLGLLKPDAGSVRFDGHDLVGMPIYRRARLGIGRTFQRLELFSGLTTRQHLLIADRARTRRGSLWKDLLNRGGPAPDELERADETMALLGISAVADTPAEALTLGQGRLVEIGRALMTGPKLLMLDEPSSGLDRNETGALASVLERVRAERGAAILLVEHDLEMVRRLAERLYVLDFGQLIADGPPAEVMADRAVRAAYLGTGA